MPQIYYIILSFTELLHDVARDQARYVKSALKNSSGSSFNTQGLNGQKSTSPTPTPTNTNSKTHLPGRIASAYAEIAVLNDEKIFLAQSLIKLLSLTKARLDVDLVKVKTLQGEPIDDKSTSLSQLHPSISLDKRSEALSGISTVAQINQSLRNATMNMQTDTAGPGYNKSEQSDLFQHSVNAGGENMLQILSPTLQNVVLLPTPLSNFQVQLEVPHHRLFHDLARLVSHRL